MTPRPLAPSRAVSVPRRAPVHRCPAGCDWRRPARGDSGALVAGAVVAYRAWAPVALELVVVPFVLAVSQARLGWRPGAILRAGPVLDPEDTHSALWPMAHRWPARRVRVHAFAEVDHRAVRARLAATGLVVAMDAAPLRALARFGLAPLGVPLVTLSDTGLGDAAGCPVPALTECALAASALDPRGAAPAGPGPTLLERVLAAAVPLLPERVDSARP